LTLPGDGATLGAQPAAPGLSAPSAVEVLPTSHGAPGSGAVAAGELAGGSAPAAAGGVTPGSDPLVAVPGFGHPGLGSGDPVAALSPGLGPGTGVNSAPDPAFTAQRPSAADIAASAPPPGSGQGSSAVDAVTQFTADHRALVTAAIAGLVGAAIVGPRVGNVTAVADIAFTNVRLIPCAVKEGARRGGAAIAGAVANGGTLAVEAGGRAAEAVNHVQAASREGLAHAAASVRHGFQAAIESPPPHATVDGEEDNRFLFVLGILLALVYGVAVGVCLRVLRDARSS
jgi:hypothetical protein